MKKISRPPDVGNEERKWEQIVMDILKSFHCDHDNTIECNGPYFNHQKGQLGTLQNISNRFDIEQMC